jgi:hypothetical protein
MSISSVNAAYQINPVQSNPSAKTAAPPEPPAPKQDSVHLSAAALKGGDADHDGDSK